MTLKISKNTSLKEFQVFLTAFEFDRVLAI
jgi:hypothetical protein